MRTLFIHPVIVACALTIGCNVDVAGPMTMDADRDGLTWVNGDCDDNDSNVGACDDLTWQGVIVTTGLRHTCAVYEDGVTRCWGDNSYQQSDAPEGAQLVSIDAGRNHNCGLTESGDAICWGSDQYGQGSPPNFEFTDVSAGKWHSCGITAEANIECWGPNDGGATDFGQISSRPSSGEWLKVATGYDHVCAIDVAGEVTLTPKTRFDDIAAGDQYSCGLRKNQTIQCWGNAPAAPTGTYVAMSSFGEHVCGLTSDGIVECDGSADLGQLDTPEQDFTSIAAGGSHTCGITQLKAVVCWGNDAQGQSSQGN